MTLDLGHGQRVTATATAQRLDAGAGYPDGEKLLGCPRLPDTHVCHSEVVPAHFDEISVMSATGTSCATARAVMQSVARWISDRCYEHLCVSKHRINRGFRCDAGLKGEASWDIICDRGNAEVRGWGRHRLDCVPGITGWWQVLGRNNIPFREMGEIDYAYVTSWSFWGDFKLLVRTIPVVIGRRGSN